MAVDINNLTDLQKQQLEELKIKIHENQFPYFDDTELLTYLEMNNWSVNITAYDCLILKAETTGINVSGLTTKDSSAYFKMLAQKYQPTNSGVLGGV